MRTPKYRKHSSGQARVTLGGNTYYLGKYGTKESHDEYKRLVGEFIACGGVVIPESAKGDLAIAEMFLAYLGWAKEHYGKGSGELDRIKRIIRLVNEQYSHIEASKFGFAQFEAIRNSMVRTGVGRKYVNESTKRLIRIFKWAASRGMIQPSVPQSLAMIEPLKRGRTTAPEPKAVKPVEPEVVDQTLLHLPKVVADMVRLQSLIGCRPGEVCMIMPKHVDRSGDVWEICFDQHKTAWKGKSRTVYVGPRAQLILRPYLLRGEDEFCFSPRESERQRRAAQHASRTTPISCGSRPGSNRKRNPKRAARSHYDDASYRRAIHRACDKAFPAPEGLTDDQVKEWQRSHRWSPNQLRHSFGTAVRRTEGIEAARILLGHSDAATTTIYAEQDRCKAIEAAMRVG
ncbi:site-specific tyrosine recombinase XerC [Stieleria maiorica]|uniref:Site-specific tyrosine recombinase XerC n=1 Tax=Stieleria maiorica TaxID=2795974 RepID=A0A5B9MK71_9BACT|nr:site-specific integrase [Stieleria maiorica]QEG01609.1 site-specific tyrosine recombinase XerC [Stieleria maiorica]